MPVYTFRFEDGSEFDEIFASWRDAPTELTVEGRGTARRVPARFNSHFPNPGLKLKAAEGVVPYEKGMDRDWKRARQYRLDRERQELHESIEKTLSAF